MSQTTRDWQQWGEFDPLYAVASGPGLDRKGDRPWTTDAFYAAGVSVWGEVLPQWRQYAGDPRGRMLEIGCGAGRITRQLAAAFPEVVGVDVSPAQLALAEAAVVDQPARCSFELSTGPRLPVDDGSIDAVFSTHVFQHLDPPVARALLEDCGRALRAGGSAMLHLPIAGTSGAGSHLGSISRRWARIEPLRIRAMRIGHRLGRTVPPMRFRLFDPAWVFAAMQRGGLRELELRAFEIGGTRHSFFCGRQPDS